MRARAANGRRTPAIVGQRAEGGRPSICHSSTTPGSYPWPRPVIPVEEPKPDAVAAPAAAVGRPETARSPGTPPTSPAQVRPRPEITPGRGRTVADRTGRPSPASDLQFRRAGPPGDGCQFAATATAWSSCASSCCSCVLSACRPSKSAVRSSSGSEPIEYFVRRDASHHSRSPRSANHRRSRSSRCALLRSQSRAVLG